MNEHKDVSGESHRRRNGIRRCYVGLMRHNTSLEQGVCAMLMMALQCGHAPLSGSAMSTILRISDSYLKKILHKLVLAGLIESTPSRGGGYVLARNLADVTLRDMYEALETLPSPVISDLPSRIFPNPAHTEAVIRHLDRAFIAANEAYLTQLSTVRLSDLLVSHSHENGIIDWAKIAQKTRKSDAENTADEASAHRR